MPRRRGGEIDVAGNIQIVCSGKDAEVPTVAMLQFDDPDCPGGGTRMTVGGQTVKMCDGADGEDGVLQTPHRVKKKWSVFGFFFYSLDAAHAILHEFF